MKRQHKATVIGGGLEKSVSIGDLDEFMDWKINQGDPSGAQELYACVAWVYWCVNQRAGNISQIPYLVFPIELPEEDESKDAASEWGIDLRTTIWAVEAWLRLKGAAYVLKVMEGSTLVDLQVLNANTMKVKTWDSSGPLTFEQRVDKDRVIYQAEELLYFRLFNPANDIREGTSSGQVAQLPATLIKRVNEYGTGFFEHGAIPAVILTTAGTVGKAEKERIQGVWNKVLKGIQRVFGTIVLEKGLTPTVIGQTMVDLAMPDLEKAKKEQILAANDLPPGMAEPRMGLADRRAIMEDLWINHLKPSTETWIEPVFNGQLFNELGLRLSFQYNELEVMQRLELEKSEGAAFLANIIQKAFESGVASWEEYRSWVGQLGKWSSMPPLDKNFQYEEPVTPPALEAFTGQQPPPGDEDGGDDAADVDIEARIESRLPKSLTDDLSRWERKAVTRIKEGFPSKALEFASDAIPAVMHRMIVHSLEHAATLGDVAEVFKSARGESKQIHFIPEGQGEPLPPVPDTVTISDADMDRAIRDWNKRMPEFAGLLESEVIHRENFDVGTEQ